MKKILKSYDEIFLDTKGEKSTAGSAGLSCWCATIKAISRNNMESSKYEKYKAIESALEKYCH